MNQRDKLTDINITDLIASFKLERFTWAHPFLRMAFRPPARWFADLVTIYDQRVERDGLAAGAAWILGEIESTTTVHNTLPAEGPVIITANHPGVGDTMALAAAVGRDDVRYIAYRRPFLQALQATSRYMLYVEDDPAQRMTVIRQATRHLQNGGVIVTFPGGSIDPDPAGAPGAVQALEKWSPSVTLLARRTPDAAIIPTLISGVISPRARRSPLTWLYTDPRQREWVAATLQLALPVYRHTHIDVHFGAPLTATHHSRDTLMQAIIARMAHLIMAHGGPHYDGTLNTPQAAYALSNGAPR